MDSGSQIDIWFKNNIILIEFGDIMQGFVQNMKDPNPSLFEFSIIFHLIFLPKVLAWHIEESSTERGMEGIVYHQ